MAITITNANKVLLPIGVELTNDAYAKAQEGAFIAGRFDITSYANATGEVVLCQLLGFSEIYGMVITQGENIATTEGTCVYKAVVAADRLSVTIFAYATLDGSTVDNTTDLGFAHYIAWGKRLTDTQQLSP